MITVNSISSPFRPLAFARRSLTLLLVLFVAEAAVFGASFKLEGQSKGSGNWISGSLQNWQDLDSIPCRIRITGSAVRDQSITITFPRLNGIAPGFEDLSGFTTSPNVVITRAPKLSTPAREDWSYTFRINYTGGKPGYVQFQARLAAGASLSPGNSLALKGKPSAMGTLLIHEPEANDDASSLGIPEKIERGNMLPGTGFMVEFATKLNGLYAIQYSSDLQSWKNAQSVIQGNGLSGRWVDSGPPVTESAPQTQPMRFYRLRLLSFQVPDCRRECDGGRHRNGCHWQGGKGGDDRDEEGRDHRDREDWDSDDRDSGDRDDKGCGHQDCSRDARDSDARDCEHRHRG
jgi:hypothetical protein